MSSDYRDARSVSETSEAPEPGPSGSGLSDTGTQAMQGKPESHTADSTSTEDDVSNPAQKGSDFETWARSEVFHGDARRLVIRPEANEHLDRLGDGVGITKNRRISDAYLDSDGSVWELKAGYEAGGIDQDQLYEYSLMEDAGCVYLRDGDNVEKAPVTSINYLFETKAGAVANARDLGGRATPWYRDEEGGVQMLED
jgi:hypothetical protein